MNFLYKILGIPQISKEEVIFNIDNFNEWVKTTNSINFHINYLDYKNLQRLHILEYLINAYKYDKRIYKYYSKKYYLMDAFYRQIMDNWKNQKI